MDKVVMQSEEGLDERIDEGVLRWFSHVERMVSDRIAKRVYVRECAGRRSLGKQRLFKEKRFGDQASKENGTG